MEELLRARPCAGSQGPQNQDLAPTLWRTIDHWKNLADRGSAHPEYLQVPGQSYEVFWIRKDFPEEVTSVETSGKRRIRADKEDMGRGRRSEGTVSRGVQG